jgi:hypothetical protein
MLTKKQQGKHHQQQPPALKRLQMQEQGTKALSYCCMPQPTVTAQTQGEAQLP